VGFGYYLGTGFLAALAGWQAVERHSYPLAIAAGAGALVTASVAASGVVWPLVSLITGQTMSYDLSFFLLVVCLLAVPGALLGLLGGWAARRNSVCHAT
jgi:hypothetical protein